MVKRYYYDSHEQFRAHLFDFVSTYSFTGRLNNIYGLPPLDAMCEA